MLYLFSFCVFIGRHSKNDLLYSLKLLINSLEKTNNYKLIVFKNFDIRINNKNVTLYEYFDTEQKHNFGDKWFNLSFNKLYIYKYLYEKEGIDYIWIDLDTIITSNIEYLNKIDNIFVICGGSHKNNRTLFKNNKKFLIEQHRLIQGNFWKLNKKLYDDIMISFQEIKKNKWKLCFDAQDLFSYYIYFKINMKNINIYGFNYKKNVLTGMSIWSKLSGYQHPNVNGLNNLYFDNNNILRTNYDKDKEIHIVTFTFFTLNTLKNNKKFKELFIDNLNKRNFKKSNDFIEETDFYFHKKIDQLITLLTNNLPITTIFN